MIHNSVCSKPSAIFLDSATDTQLTESARTRSKVFQLKVPLKVLLKVSLKVFPAARTVDESYIESVYTNKFSQIGLYHRIPPENGPQRGRIRVCQYVVREVLHCDRPFSY